MLAQRGEVEGDNLGVVVAGQILDKKEQRVISLLIEAIEHQVDIIIDIIDGDGSNVGEVAPKLLPHRILGLVIVDLAEGGEYASPQNYFVVERDTLVNAGPPVHHCASNVHGIILQHDGWVVVLLQDLEVDSFLWHVVHIIELSIIDPEVDYA